MGKSDVCVEGTTTTKVQRFINNLWQHQQNHEFCDFTLITKGSPIECHKVVLSAASPYFKSLFFDNKEHKATKFHKMDLSETSLNVLNTAVAFMYNSDYNITGSNVIELLKLSVKWQLDPLSKECSQYMSNNITLEKAVKYYSFIVNSSEFWDSTKFKCFLSEHFSELFEQGYLKKLSLSSFCTFIADDNLSVKAEDEVFSAAMQIINKQTSEADIDKCVGLIRFHQMSANFLLDVVQPHPVMLTQERCLRVREALRYQLTNQPSPSTAKGKRRTSLDIHYMADGHIYRYIQGTSDVTARLVSLIPPVIASNAPVAYSSNKLVFVSGHDVTLINLAGSLNIEHLPRLSYRWDGCKVILNDDGIYILNCLPETSRPDLCAPHRPNRGYFNRDNSMVHLSQSNKVWANAQPMPFAMVSPLVVSHKQYIYVFGCQPDSMSDSFVFRYNTTNNSWKQCDRFPVAVTVSSNKAHVLVHDNAINVFTSTTRFKYNEVSDTWSADYYEMEGDVVKVFVNEQHIRCITHQTPISKYGYDDEYGAVAYPEPGSLTMESKTPGYYLQTYDVKINQWVEKQKIELGDKEPNFFF